MKCYSCGQERDRKPEKFRDQYRKANLPDKVMVLFFVPIVVAMFVLLVAGASALIIESIR